MKAKNASQDLDSATKQPLGRAICQVCATPLQRCICDLITAVDSEVDVVVWQHPSETNHPKGTANLLTRCLPRSHLMIAEHMSQVDFSSRLPQSTSSLLLLFPELDQHHSLQQEMLPAGSDSIRLLVIDGSWRKARRIFYQNPWLQRLPRLTLESTLSSGYRIRKAEKEGQLSTLEATCAAIEQIEGKPALCQPIRDAFQCYMDRLERFVPARGD